MYDLHMHYFHSDTTAFNGHCDQVQMKPTAHLHVEA